MKNRANASNMISEGKLAGTNVRRRLPEALQPARRVNPSARRRRPQRCGASLRRFLIPLDDQELIRWQVPNSSPHLQNMKMLVTKCERIEAAFRAIRRELESLPKTETIHGLLRQNEIDIEAAVQRARIARDVPKREKAGLN